jgi:hypothetical protein
MEIPTIITPQTAAATKVINTARDVRPGCLFVVGPLGEGESIQIKIPTVNDADPTNAAHWQQLYQDGVAVTLTSSHNAEAIPVGMIVLISKPLTAQSVGVGWS